MIPDEVIRAISEDPKMIASRDKAAHARAEGRTVPLERDVKQVIVIRKDLGMRRGKEIAQGSHASIAWLTNRLTPLSSKFGDDGKIPMIASLTQAEWDWTHDNFRKICCVVDNEQDLIAVYNEARMLGVTAEIIQDSGLTEFGGVPTFTAVAVGPDYDEKIDPITGDLKLY